MTTRLLLVLVLTGVVATTANAASPSPSPSCPSYNPPDELTLSAGTPQSARLGTPFDTNLQVAVAATNGCPLTTPLAGIAITFAAPSTGPSGTFGASGANAVLVGTDASGTARASSFTANDLPGGYLVTASSSVGSVTFSLVNTAAGVSASIVPVSPRSQSALVSTRYHDPLRVRVLDADGNQVQGANVTFDLGGAGAGGNGDAATAGGSFDGGGAQATAQTDGTGTATSPRIVAGAVAGTFTATATVSGVPDATRFTLHNVAAGAVRIRSVGVAARTAVVNTVYRSALAVKIRDGAGRPLAGVTVTFALAAAGGGAGAAGGAGATFAGDAVQATATTNARGVARAPRLTANATAGSFTATASVPGAAHALVFPLRNRAGAPSSIAAGAGATQSAVVDGRFAVPFAVTVDDANGNPVAGVPVRFSAPARGATGAFVAGRRYRRTVTVRTNAAGVAVAPQFVAGPVAGGYAVTASVRAGGATGFALVNRPRP